MQCLNVVLFYLQTNTFQSVIATDGFNTYVINQYLDNGINWGQCGGNNAQAGVTGAMDTLGPPSSGTPQIANIEMGSNVGEAGKYVYCVHGAMKQEPVSKSLIIIIALAHSGGGGYHSGIISIIVMISGVECS